jgi:hypothetical protein
VANDDILPSLRILLCEYCKYLIDRAWYHYPGELPKDMIAEKPQSGVINRELAIPLEDMYEGWQKAGQVGQQVYGAAAPFVFATRHCHRIDGVDFIIHCNYPIHGFAVRRRKGRPIKRVGAVHFNLVGDPRCRANIHIVPDDYVALPEIVVKAGRGSKSQIVEGERTDTGNLKFEIPGDADVSVTWKR